MQANHIDISDLFSVDALAARYPHILSKHTLRYQLRDRERNGLSRACVRIGKKLLISHARYQEWLAEATQAHGGAN